MWNGQPTWIVSRYPDIRAALVDPRLSADTLSDLIRPSSDESTPVIFARIDDPEGVLKGEGKQMRHIQIKSAADLGSPVIRDYLTRAIPEGAVRSKKLATKIYPSKRTP